MAGVPPLLLRPARLRRHPPTVCTPTATPGRCNAPRGGLVHVVAARGPRRREDQSRGGMVQGARPPVLVGAAARMVGPTLEDVRLTMVEGDMRPPVGPAPQRPARRVDRGLLEPGAVRAVPGQRHPLERLLDGEAGPRCGPQHHYAWGDEPAEWADASVDPLTTTSGTTMSNLAFGLRLGQDPRLLLTGTPKTVLLIRRLLWQDGDASKRPRPRGRDRPQPAPTTTWPTSRPRSASRSSGDYEGTTLGLQELEAEYLDETPGALWTREQLQRDRVRDATWTQLTRIAVGVDPSGGAGEQGIVVVGKTNRREGYVLDDRSGRSQPRRVGPGRRPGLARLAGRRHRGRDQLRRRHGQEHDRGRRRPRSWTNTANWSADGALDPDAAITTARTSGSPTPPGEEGPRRTRSARPASRAISTWSACTAASRTS